MNTLFKSMNKALYEDHICKFSIKDGITYIVYKPEVVDLEVAEKCTAKRHEILPETPLYVITDYTAVKNTTREARQYFTGPYASYNMKAVVLLINSPVGRIMGNFFISLNKPPYDFKLFNDLFKAEEWVRKHMP